MQSPRPSRDVVLKKLQHCFPHADTASSALVILDSYGSSDAEPERERVQLALLKLSKGDIAQLTDYLQVAKKDYRDVLAWAEYPNSMSKAPELAPSGSDERRRLDEADRRQYLDWLNSSEC